MPEAPELCPICQSEMVITRFYCPRCETTIEGYFNRKSNPFAKLSDEQRDFLLTFVRLEGRLNRMEETLGISYPTLKNRLTEVIHALGFETDRESASPSVDRQQILENLNQGLITPNEASELVQSLQKQDKIEIYTQWLPAYDWTLETITPDQQEAERLASKWIQEPTIRKVILVNAGTVIKTIRKPESRPVI